MKSFYIKTKTEESEPYLTSDGWSEKFGERLKFPSRRAAEKYLDANVSKDWRAFYKICKN